MTYDYLCCARTFHILIRDTPLLDYAGAPTCNETRLLRGHPSLVCALPLAGGLAAAQLNSTIVGSIRGSQAGERSRRHREPGAGGRARGRK